MTADRDLVVGDASPPEPGPRGEAGRPVIVLHATGDAEGGSGWAHAFDSQGQRAIAPTLPGHAGTAPPPGGTYDLADPGYVAAATLTDAELSAAFAVIGVGASGWSATIMAVAGVGRALVLVDGLGDPWVPLGERLARRRDRLRRLADVATGEAMPPEAPAPGVDPFVAWSPEPLGDRELAMAMAAALEVPALILRSPVSAAPDPEVVAAFGGGATVIDVTAAVPSVVAPVVTDWLAAR